MKPGITAKLFCWILAACATVLAVNLVSTRIAFERGFMGYLNGQGVERMVQILPRVQAAYAAHGSWAFVRADEHVWFDMIRPLEAEAFPNTPRAPAMSDQSGTVFRLALLDADGQTVAGNPSRDPKAIRQPIVVDGKQVGWLSMLPFEHVLAPNEKRFFEDQRKMWTTIGIASVLVAASLAWLLSRALLRRVRLLASATHRLAAGDFASRVAPGPDDELGHLGQDFNRMADTLEKTEQTRRAFMADISHELRTPLAVLRAELEAMQDGIRPMEASSVTTLQGEVRQLGKLVDDLYDLALTQSGKLAYRHETLDLHALVSATAEGFRGRFDDAGLRLSLTGAGEHVTVRGDERRLQQLFANLLENALRYTDAGGQVVVDIHASEGMARVAIDDTTPGVGDDKRGKLFERFFRVDASRNRASGGSGLGLAICHSIALAHDGTIHAEASPLGGLRIVVALPVLS